MVSQVFLQGRIFARSRSANTVEVHAPVLSSINAANADYDTVSSQTDSSDSMLSDYQNLYDPPAAARLAASSSLSSKKKKPFCCISNLKFIS